MVEGLRKLGRDNAVRSVAAGSRENGEDLLAKHPDGLQVGQLGQRNLSGTAFALSPAEALAARP